MAFLNLDGSLASTAQLTLLVAGVVLALGLSFALSMTCVYLAFHAGRWIYGCHTDWRHPGTLGALAVGFGFYSILFSLAPHASHMWYVSVNVPFGVGFMSVLVLTVFAIGVGFGRATGLIRGATRGKERKE